MLEQFSKVKNNLLKFTNDMYNCNSIDKVVIENSRLKEEINNLVNGEFKVALIAPFSAGKSTFINSLIGRDLLSMEITAETSVITKVKFSKEIKVDIKYKKGNKKERIEKNQQGKILSHEEIKEILELKTTVKGENTEDNIDEVTVYYPIEMCKDNIELIDTPGLFARHEKHEAITNSILPQVNAVIFMIDPESVGEEHFTEIIQNYVRNAKNSNLEEDGRHIFFVINKIDVFDPEDIEKARRELQVVLKDIIKTPQIYEISAYYAMMGKMFVSGNVDLVRLQKDRKIKITDPEDPEYTLSGRQLTSENAANVLKESKIKNLEMGLEKYLQNKNMYLINDLKNTVHDIITQSIKKIEFERQNIDESYNLDKAKYEKQLKNLKEEIKILNKQYSMKLRNHISKKMIGDSSGSGIADKIDGKIKEELDEVRREINALIDRKWRNYSQGISRENAEDKLQNIINDVDDELNIKAKEVAKKSFNDIKKHVLSLSDYIREVLDEIKLDVERTELKNIGKNISNIGNYNIDNVLDSIIKVTENEFSNMITSISKELRSKVDEAEEDSEYVEEKSGIFYSIKKFFTGKEEYIHKFNSAKFKKELDAIIDDLQTNMREYIDACSAEIGKRVNEAANSIVDKLIEESETIILNVESVKQSLIDNIISSISKNEEEKLNLLKKKQIDVSENKALLKRFNNLIKSLEVK